MTSDETRKLIDKGLTTYFKICNGWWYDEHPEDKTLLINNLDAVMAFINARNLKVSRMGYNDYKYLLILADRNRDIENGRIVFSADNIQLSMFNDRHVFVTNINKEGISGSLGTKSISIISFDNDGIKDIDAPGITSLRGCSNEAIIMKVAAYQKWHYPNALIPVITKKPVETSDTMRTIKV
ncbi:MAG: hypothetical protein J5892_01385 [Bacilli bacterium]|nr:hypothetical protein [Bacilli bacterium]